MPRQSAKEFARAEPERMKMCWEGLLVEWEQRGGFARRHIQPRGYGGVGLRALHQQKRVNIVFLARPAGEDAWPVVVTPRETDARPIAMKLLLSGEF